MNDLQSDTTQRALFYIRAAKNESGDDDPRQTKLKSELEANPSLRVRRYADAARLAEVLYADLLKQLELDFPLQSLPTPLERERMAHEAFEESRARIYIGRQYYFDTINAHMATDDVVPILVAGKSGLGKVPMFIAPSVALLMSHCHGRVHLCAIGPSNTESRTQQRWSLHITLAARH